MTRDDVLGQLQKDFPGWEIGRPRTHTGEDGGWLATRNGVLSTEEMRGGLLHTLVGDTAEQLRDALVEQAKIETGAPEEPA
jgi:starvation-inducible outer membrane lipoprotein